jgi:methylenetetrahydrofolate dehydrogenase (NADP+)/methenyltetrahydrofolate cyclohydrolase
VTERLLGAPVAEALNRSTRQVLATIPHGGDPPCLASVHLGREGPFRRYLTGQKKVATELGLRFREELVPADGGPAALVDRIRSLDHDPSVHGVLIEHPLPPPYDFPEAMGQLRAEKDVDGAGTENLGRLLTGREGHAPAVCRAALAVARHYRLPVESASVTVVGRSATVGLPLALLLMQRPPGPNATVTVAHSGTPDLTRSLLSAQTIFSCSGTPHLLTRSVVPKDAAVVDIGLSPLPDPGHPGGVRMVGDADPDSLEGWASAFSPVPGGVGPVTVAQLMWNTVHAWQMQTGGRLAP